jgi:tRNA (cmo5U34)-methyltransferase
MDGGVATDCEEFTSEEHPMKSTVDQIRARFDADVERFSNLETGQTAAVDSPLCMDLIARAAAAVTPGARHLLDLGCGAGNYTLKLLEALRPAETIACTLVDLSKPMLDRAVQRITPQTRGTVTPLQGDMRTLELGEEAFDIIVSAATLHHLRGDEEWPAMFGKMYRALRPGGGLWIFDMVQHAHPAVESLMHAKYGEYLSALKGGGPAGAAYREKVFAYIEEEDTPRPLMYQLELMRKAGFTDIDVLHKNVMGAAFGGRRP